MTMTERDTDQMPALDLAEVIVDQVGKNLEKAVLNGNYFHCKIEADGGKALKSKDGSILSARGGYARRLAESRPRSPHKWTQKHAPSH